MKLRFCVIVQLFWWEESLPFRKNIAQPTLLFWLEMDPQIIIFALSFSFISDCVRGVFSTGLKKKNKLPSFAGSPCYSISQGNDSIVPSCSSCSVLPSLHISLLTLFWTLPALCSSPGQEEKLWSIVACYFAEEGRALPSQLSLFITSTQTGLKEHDEEMLQYTTKRSGNYSGHSRSLCACGVFGSKVIVPRRRVSWQSIQKSREIMSEWGL